VIPVVEQRGPVREEGRRVWPWPPPPTTSRHFGTVVSVPLQAMSRAPTITSVMAMVDMPMVTGSKTHLKRQIVVRTLTQLYGRRFATRSINCETRASPAWPGTWTKRIAGRAHRLGLVVEAIGFDISGGQLEIARKNAEHLNAGYPSDTTKLGFLTHDLAEPLPGVTDTFILFCAIASSSTICPKAPC
jgi:hypothetical protein